VLKCHASRLDRIDLPFRQGLANSMSNTAAGIISAQFETFKGRGCWSAVALVPTSEAAGALAWPREIADWLPEEQLP
jgi:hypothetical protein